MIPVLLKINRFTEGVNRGFTVRIEIFFVSSLENRLKPLCLLPDLEFSYSVGIFVFRDLRLSTCSVLPPLRPNG